MFRKVLKILTISTGLLVLAVADRALNNPLGGEFQRYSQALENSDLPVSSLERFIFSLVLSTRCHSGPAVPAS